VPVLKSADEVEALRNKDGGFDISVSISHPGGISELYYGQIKGPQIQLSTDMVMRGSHSKDYSAATRIFGLVEGNLLWRWDVATGGRQGRLRNRAMAWRPTRLLSSKRSPDRNRSGTRNSETLFGALPFGYFGLRSPCRVRSNPMECPG
jgi:hypothetical protein